MFFIPIFAALAIAAIGTTTACAIAADNSSKEAERKRREAERYNRQIREELRRLREAKNRSIRRAVLSTHINKIKHLMHESYACIEPSFQAFLDSKKVKESVIQTLKKHQQSLHRLDSRVQSAAESIKTHLAAYNNQSYPKLKKWYGNIFNGKDAEQAKKSIKQYLKDPKNLKYKNQSIARFNKLNSLFKTYYTALNKRNALDRMDKPINGIHSKLQFLKTSVNQLDVEIKNAFTIHKKYVEKFHALKADFNKQVKAFKRLRITH